MTTIRTTCRMCGTIDLTVEQVALEPGRYCFHCPNCHVHRSLPASDKTIKILVLAGVEYVHPITEDEIDLFVMELDLREGIER